MKAVISSIFNFIKTAGAPLLDWDACLLFKPCSQFCWHFGLDCGLLVFYKYRIVFGFSTFFGDRFDLKVVVCAHTVVQTVCCRRRRSGDIFVLKGSEL
jgi:hypothetical protein